MSNKKIKYKPINPEVVTLAAEYRYQKQAILEILKELHSRYGYLNSQQLIDTARALNIPPEKAFGIASFYSMLNLQDDHRKILKICDGPVCWLCGADKVRSSLEQAFSNHTDWKIERTSCLGMCDQAPAGWVDNRLIGPIGIDRDTDIERIWRSVGRDYTQPRPNEMRVMLKNLGKIDPNSIESALQFGVYQGLLAALQKNPMDVIAEIESSGLTGRGGAGFPVGRKWRFVATANRYPRYIICNADESEPLIFKDRILIDNDPHQILEGMAIAGYACGANEGYIYIRGEYAAQAERLELAIHQAEAVGLLGQSISGTDFCFTIHVHRGAGAYICGEETALIESLEGKRGEPRNRPPYPPTSGFNNLPTLVNNVESFAAVPAIILNGALWYRSLSAATTPGTKIYMVLGHINKPGVFEAPFGLTLRQVIEEYSGGMKPGSNFKFALTGGAAGTIVSEAHLDIPIDYASASKGISLGAGAFLICDEQISVPELLCNLLNFFRQESCGKCTPCRVGTTRAYEILKQICAGKGQLEHMDELRSLADVMFDSSFCGLGQSVSVPIRTALEHFANEFQKLIGS
jgi:NADH:ubiquinone oxidoreductase subunit F (NADH-binding)/NADH:ubiquinone oxidoreductase subunit E